MSLKKMLAVFVTCTAILSACGEKPADVPASPTEVQTPSLTEAVVSKDAVIVEEEIKEYTMDTPDSFGEISYSYPSGWKKDEGDRNNKYHDEENAIWLLVSREAKTQEYNENTYLKVLQRKYSEYSLADKGSFQFDGIDIYKIVSSSLDETSVFYGFWTNRYSYLLTIRNAGEEDTVLEEAFWGTASIKKDPLYPTDDFLSDAERMSEYKELAKAGKYADIYEMITVYMEEKDVQENDTAWIIKNTLDPVMEVWDNIEYSYDAVDEKTTYTYKGLGTIKNGNHIVPCCYSNDTGIWIELGFTRGNWFFFDEYTITTTGDDIHANIRLTDKRQDVLGAGSVYESWTFHDLKPSKIKTIVDNEDAVIRFENDNGDKLDFEITDKEKEALRAMSAFYWVSNDLSDIPFSYENKKIFESWNTDE